MIKIFIAIILSLAIGNASYAADLGCGRDTDLNGTVDNYCPGSDADNDGYTTAQGDCDDNDFDIYPGAYWSGSKVGCSTGYWRTCKADGTGYTACSNATWCPDTSDTAVINGAPASQCIYVDNSGNDTTGDGSYSNPYKTLDKIAALTNGATNLTQGTAVIFKGTGTITGTVTPYSDSTVENEPGSATSRFILAGYPSTSFTTMPKVGWQVQTGNTDYVVYHQFEITYTAGIGVNGGVYVNSSAYADIRGMYVHDVIRPTQNNIGCINIEEDGLGHTVRNNYVANCYGASGANSTHGVNILIFNPRQSDISYNDFYNTDAAMPQAADIEFKHGDYTGTNTIIGNYFSGTVSSDYAIHTQGDIGNEVAYNFITSTKHCVHMENDLDGTKRFNGGSSYHHNTCLSDQSTIVYTPDKLFNINDTQAADECSGNITWGNITFNHNILISSQSTFTGFQFATYGQNAILTDLLAVLTVDYNGYWGTGGDTNPDMSMFSSNSGGSGSCVASGDQGTTYSGFTAIQAAGFEANGVNEDPGFDSSYIAANTNLAGFGYMQPADSGGGGSPVAVGGRAPFRRW